MLGLGWSEMLVLAVVVLIVVGPKDLPMMLRNLGRMMGGVRRMSNEFRREIDKAIAVDEVKEAKRALSEPLRQTSQEINREFNAIRNGKVEPSGRLKPSEPGAESVADEIRAQAGVAPAKADGAGALPAASAKTKAVTPPSRTPAPAQAAAKAGAKTATSSGGAKAGKAASPKSTGKATRAGKAKPSEAGTGKAAAKPAPKTNGAGTATESKATRSAPKRKAPARKSAPKKAEAHAGSDSGER